jgi:RAP1 GTPase activating protein 1
MFHVSTYLPYDSSNRQQLERKRHLGNDIVVLIFADGNTPYLANAIKSEFNRTHALPAVSSSGSQRTYLVGARWPDVFIVVQPVKLPNGAMAYRYMLSPPPDRRSVAVRGCVVPF